MAAEIKRLVPRYAESIEDGVLAASRLKNDGIPTDTSYEQGNVEKEIEKMFLAARAKYFGEMEKSSKDDSGSEEIFIDRPRNSSPPSLKKKRHIDFLTAGLRELGVSYQCLDASRTWICYWILHSLDLLDALPLSSDLETQIANFLNRCQHPDGGFGGGPGQEPHLASTYAAVNALCILGSKHSFDVIDRPKLLSFFFRMKQADGSFTLHENGETDVRGIYLVASAAVLSNIVSSCSRLFYLSPEWVASCQTYEGGFAGRPGLEAHGGYTFCGLAALCLLGKLHLCDTKLLLRWIANRQMKFEGGFQGRTEKLVDGCYSFWQGGAIALLQSALQQQGELGFPADTWVFHSGALQEYVLTCCQHMRGGLRDKPKKSRDFYHTCYCLSGLSIAQHNGSKLALHILGGDDNEVRPTHPTFNICGNSVYRALQYFKSLSIPDDP